MSDMAEKKKEDEYKIVEDKEVASIPLGFTVGEIRLKKGKSTADDRDAEYIAKRIVVEDRDASAVFRNVTGYCDLLDLRCTTPDCRNCMFAPIRGQVVKRSIKLAQEMCDKYDDDD